MVANILKNQTGSKSFEDKMNKQRKVEEIEELERVAQMSEEAITTAVAADPDVRPEDVPLVAIQPKIFLCQHTLESCLDKIIEDILPTNTVFQQE